MSSDASPDRRTHALGLRRRGSRDGSLGARTFPRDFRAPSCHGAAGSTPRNTRRPRGSTSSPPSWPAFSRAKTTRRSTGATALALGSWTGAGRRWGTELIAAAAEGLSGGAESLARRLPPLAHPLEIIGKIAPYFVERHGFDPACAIVAGSGDNPQSKVMAGGALLSLGTSFVLMCPGELPHPSANAMYDGLGRPFPLRLQDERGARLGSSPHRGGSVPGRLRSLRARARANRPRLEASRLPAPPRELPPLSGPRHGAPRRLRRGLRSRRRFLARSHRIRRLRFREKDR